MTDDRLVGYFQKHLPPMFFEFKKGTETPITAVITAFILSVDDQWFLVTAGHCFQKIDEFIENSYEMTKCRLIDSMGLDAKHLESIPFTFQRKEVIRLDADEEFSDFDYGAIRLSSYYQQLLEKNNIQALNEDTWKHYPQSVDFYYLLGIPGELTAVNSGNLSVETTMHLVDRLHQRPEEFPETSVPLFYGHIELGQQMNSIKGMSGGPIFAFHTNEKGEMRCWLVALLSSWNPNTQNIVACQTRFLGNILVGLSQSRKQCPC